MNTLKWSNFLIKKRISYGYHTDYFFKVLEDIQTIKMPQKGTVRNKTIQSPSS